jgi:hypothetical protein
MWTKILKFFTDNKVFILGLLGSMVVVLQQILLEPTIDWKTVGLGVAIAILSYLANQWRGQGVTLFGILGTLAGVIAVNLSGGTMDWKAIAIACVAAVLAAVSPPPKSINYEKSAVIEKATQQAAQITADKKITPVETTSIPTTQTI